MDAHDEGLIPNINAATNNLHGGEARRATAALHMHCVRTACPLPSHDPPGIPHRVPTAHRPHGTPPTRHTAAQHTAARHTACTAARRVTPSPFRTRRVRRRSVKRCSASWASTAPCTRWAAGARCRRRRWWSPSRRSRARRTPRHTCCASSASRVRSAMGRTDGRMGGVEGWVDGTGGSVGEWMDIYGRQGP